MLGIRVGANQVTTYHQEFTIEQVQELSLLHEAMADMENMQWTQALVASFNDQRSVVIMKVGYKENISSCSILIINF